MIQTLQSVHSRTITMVILIVVHGLWMLTIVFIHVPPFDSAQQLMKFINAVVTVSLILHGLNWVKGASLQVVKPTQTGLKNQIWANSIWMKPSHAQVAALTSMSVLEQVTNPNAKQKRTVHHHRIKMPSLKQPLTSGITPRSTTRWKPRPASLTANTT